MQRDINSVLLRLFTVMVMIFTLSLQMNGQDATNGEKIFKANCTSCHQLGGILVGPNLIGVKDRWKGREAKLYAFVKNSQAVIKSGDPYATNLYNKFNQAQMTAQNLSEKEIKDVIEYVHGGGNAATAGAPAGGSGGSSYEDVPSGFNGTGIIIIIGILVLAIAIMVRRLTNKGDKGEIFKHNKTVELINQIMFPIFFLLWTSLILFEVAYHMEYMKPEAASDIGVEIDKLFMNTLWVTLAVFIACQVCLFYFAVKYKSREGQKALHYSHNDKLELIWTSVPAVVLAGLVLFGFKTWTKATSNPDNNPVQIECYAYQFAWEFRYPGKDGKFGKTDFRLIDMGNNPFGLDYSDPNAADDFTTKELHMPVNKDVYLKIRSRDVLHAAYFPHFRAQIYASPGMDNRIRFKPIYTTSEFRDRIGKPAFNFELACNQLCGASHFNMRRVVVVDKLTDFDTWTSQFKPAYDAYKASGAIQPSLTVK